MEKPYKGRAVINETINALIIEIPSRKNWFAIFFIAAWMCGWIVGEIFGSSLLFSGIDNGGFVSLFSVAWLTMWTLGGIMAIRQWLWLVFGKEVITFDRNTITIGKKAALFSRTKTYDLNEIAFFTVNKNHAIDSFFLGNTGRRNSFNLTNSGAFSFDYGHKTIVFGEGVDLAEARILLEMLHRKKILKDKNLNINTPV